MTGNNIDNARGNRKNPAHMQSSYSRPSGSEYYHVHNNSRVSSSEYKNPPRTAGNVNQGRKTEIYRYINPYQNSQAVRKPRPASVQNMRPPVISRTTKIPERTGIKKIAGLRENNPAFMDRRKQKYSHSYRPSKAMPLITDSRNLRQALSSVSKGVSIAAEKSRWKNNAIRFDEKMRPLTKEGEIKKARTPIPVAAMSLTIICTLMIMVIIYSTAQIYQYTVDVGELEYQIKQLAKKESELSLQLEQKDDIRLIEDYATNVIGMVKGDTVEKRYITLSGGERIEIFGDPAEETEAEEKTGFFSTLLSAIGENFNAFLEKFK